MDKVFIGTNYFLRFLLKDDKVQSTEAKKLFLEGAQGKKDLLTSTIVIFEIYWVLKSFYQEKKDKILQLLRDILRLNFITFDERETLFYSLELFEKTTLELEDCYNLRYALEKEVTVLATFDKKLGREFSKLI